jgi:RNA polymerase sigma-70 factor (ECF subfamily)
VAFVLHDVFAMPFGEIADIVGRSPDACRKLASTARRHVRERRAGSAPRETHDAVVRAFIAAAGTGDLQQLLPLLDPDIVLVSDGGGLASTARRPVLGADHVGRFILGQLAKLGAALTVSLHETADGLTLAFADGDVVHSVAVLDVRDDRIARVWIMRNPEKLGLWNT